MADYSANYREKTASTSGEAPVYLLEITHPQLAIPIRVARDNSDIVSNGDTYVAFAFEVTLPDDFATQMPRAMLAVDNVGRELVQWLEASNGGAGAQVRLMQIMRDDPDTIEVEYTLDLKNISQNPAKVVGTLGYEDTLNMPALAATYRPDNTPGVF